MPTVSIISPAVSLSLKMTLCFFWKKNFLLLKHAPSPSLKMKRENKEIARQPIRFSTTWSFKNDQHKKNAPNPFRLLKLQLDLANNSKSEPQKKVYPRSVTHFSHWQSTIKDQQITTWATKLHKGYDAKTIKETKKRIHWNFTTLTDVRYPWTYLG